MDTINLDPICDFKLESVGEHKVCLSFTAERSAKFKYKEKKYKVKIYTYDFILDIIAELSAKYYQGQIDEAVQFKNRFINASRKYLK